MPTMLNPMKPLILGQLYTSLDNITDEELSHLLTAVISEIEWVLGVGMDA